MSVRMNEYDLAEEVNVAGEESKCKQQRARYAGVGIAVGAGIGVALGTATGNLALWLSIGVAIGAAIGAALSARRV